jgi:WD40 repeat protein/tRNA A-37 threonylcarbamoyl transferase component Bud32
MSEPASDSDALGPLLDELAARQKAGKPTDPAPHVSPPAAPRLPELLGDYRILQELGRGGMGVVYQARHTKLDRVVALKMVLSGEYASGDDLARFLGEARAVAQVQHPNVVQLLEAGEHDGLPYFTLEFIEGGTLAGKLDGTPLPSEEAARLVEGLARGVHRAHECGVVHRDLKPANVLLTKDGTPKITDFGLAKKVEGGAGLTRTGAVVGTPSYMAPEQAGHLSGAQAPPVGPSADVYSLGAILYECLTGRPPFKGPTTLETLRQVVADDPVAPSQLQPGTPRDLETICLKCLRKDPARRYTRADELADDLKRFLASEPIRARPAGSVERVLKWGRRRPTAAALLAVSVLAAASLFGVWAYFTAQLTEQVRIAEDAKKEADDQAQDAKDKAEEAKKARKATEEEKKRVIEESNRTKFQARRVEEARHALQMTFVQRGLEMGDQKEAERILGEVDEPFRQTWEQRHLASLIPRQSVRLKGHEDRVTDVAFSPDGQRVASVSYDLTVRVWDAATGQEQLRLTGHSTTILNGVAFSPDGKRIASAGGTVGPDGEVIVWDAATRQKKRTIKVPEGGVDRVTFRPDSRHLAAACMDGTVRLYDADTGELTRSLKSGFQRAGNWCVAFSSDGKLLAAGAEVNGMKVWDAETGREKYSFPRDGNGNVGVGFSPDNSHLVGIGEAGFVRLWDLATGKEEFTHATSATHLNCAALSPDGRYVAVGANDSTARVYEVETGRMVRTLTGHGGQTHSGQIYAVAFSPDGRRLASGGMDHTPMVWDLGAEGASLVLQDCQYPAYAVALSPDGKRVAAAADSRGYGFAAGFPPPPPPPGELKVWDAETGQVKLSLRNTARPVLVARTSGLLGSPLGQGPLLAASALLHGRLRDPQEVLYSVTYSADGRRLAAAGGARYMGGPPGHSSPPGQVTVWDAETGGEQVSLRTEGAPALCVTFSPDSRRIASASADGTVRVWDVTTGEEKLSRKTRAVGFGGGVPPENYQGVAFSPDGRLLASSSGGFGEPAEVRVWDVETGAEMYVLKGHEQPVLGIAFSPDGRRLATGSGDRTVKLWDAQTGEETFTLKGHTGAVTGVAFSPNGRRLVTSAAAPREGPGEVKLWDTETGQEKLALKGHNGTVHSVGFSADGRRIATGGADKMVRVWTAPPDAGKSK